MSTAYATALTDSHWEIGNAYFRLAIKHDGAGGLTVDQLTLADAAHVNWASQQRPFGPVIQIGEQVLQLGAGLTFTEAQIDAGLELRLCYTSDSGLRVTQHLTPSPDKAFWRSWVALVNESDATLEISRFDAANLNVGMSDAEPQAGYMLGWLEGPRADAPGRPPLPFKYGGWIPKFLYGEGYVIPPPPAGGWSAPVFRLVQERLTRLPLRSGKRSTYQNHPWVTVLDPARQAGFLMGFEWSGTWKMDVEHFPEDHTVSVMACTDGSTHALKPHEMLTSPAAFIGLFAGEWDDAFNACRNYVDDEIIPKVKPAWPTSLHVYWQHNRERSDESIRREIDAAAEAGFETTYVEAMWWDESSQPGQFEFSIGLGSYQDDRGKFPMGLRGMSDYVHSKGMQMGLWFEFERVDIRTANRLRNPWKPEWLVHQKGYPYRSWCQHAFLLCLGVQAAAEWALENMSWAINAYNLDYIMIDSNEWAVCDDPTHDHGAADGEWAQTQGMYHVMRSLRERFPDLMVLNSAGGSQRGDFGMARYCNCMHPHDECHPSAKQRRFQHGTGCMYPTSYQLQYLSDYYTAPDPNSGFPKAQPQKPGVFTDVKRMEWRGLNRLMGYFGSGMEVSQLPMEHRQLLQRLNRFYKRIRGCTHGNRYVLAEPKVLIEPSYTEADSWEVYEQMTPERDVVAVFFYRCLSAQPSYTARLKGLQPQAQYRVESYTEMTPQVRTGADLMANGITCALPEPRNADIFILTRE